MAAYASAGSGSTISRPLLQAVERGEQCGHRRAHPQCLLAQLAGAHVERRAEPERGAHQRHRRAQQIERRCIGRGARDVGQHGLHGRGDLAERRDLGLEVGALGERGERAFEQQVPHVLERPLLGQLHGVVLAVVVEALEAAHVADRRLRDHHSFEPARHLFGEVLGGLDLCDAHQVAHREDPHEPFAVDHRDVAVAVLGQAREGLAGVEIGADAIGVRGHPCADQVRRRVGAGRGEPHEIALGEDADRPLAVHHDHRSHPLVAHPCGHGGYLLAGRGRDHRPAHDLGYEHRASRGRAPVGGIVPALIDRQFSDDPGGDSRTLDASRFGRTLAGRVGSGLTQEVPF